MKRAVKIGQATINGKQVSFFSPAHDEPDFPWVGQYELFRAFMGRNDAKGLMKVTERFEGKKTGVAAKNGSRITTIIPHGVAQSFCGGLDRRHGHPDEGGPAFRAYCFAAGEFCRTQWPMTMDQMLAAYKNTGGSIVSMHRPASH